LSQYEEVKSLDFETGKIDQQMAEFLMLPQNGGMFDIDSTVISKLFAGKESNHPKVERH
jgi:hypothetical protein